MNRNTAKLKQLWTPLTVIGLQLYIFRDLLFHITTNLIDWRDYALLVWILGGIKNNIFSSAIQTFFDGNMYFPNKYTLLFADSFYPQALSFLPAFAITQNYISAFNIVFFLTLILNTFGAWHLWKSLKVLHPLLLLFGTLTTSLSPFFFSELSHFQMISFWPLFFALSYLLRIRLAPTAKNVAFVIMFSILQFYASVYLFTYLITIIGIYFVLVLFFIKKQQRKAFSLLALKIIAGIGIGVLPLYAFYYYIQHVYQAERQYFEYVLYSAHFTDYLFPNTWGLLSRLAPLKALSSLNRHTVGELAYFPGFALTILGGYGIAKGFKIHKGNFLYIFFLLLLITGFVFSLGPKLNINGKFVGLPLPYVVPMKLIPFYWPLRATKRWSFLLYTSLAYFSVFGLKSIVLLVCAIGVYVLEMIPFNYTSEYQNYYPPIYTAIEQQCQKNTEVLLEFPMEENHAEANVATNLSYKTTFMVSSLKHNCNLINGYSGLVPPSSQQFQMVLQQNVEDRNLDSTSQQFEENSIKLIKVNENRMSLETISDIYYILDSLPTYKLTAQDTSTRVYLRIDEQ